MKRLATLVVAATLAIPAAACAETVPALPEAMKPLRMSGMGLNVRDIEAAKTFYTDVLGYKVAARVPAKDGTAAEYLLSLSGTITDGGLLVLTNRAPVAGSTSFGRVILVVPNGRAMAERVVAAGGKADKVADGTNIVRDPEGNVIELYQRPAPRPTS